MRVLIVKLSALGDIIHCAVVVQFMKKYFREITIEWIVDSAFDEILQRIEYLDKIIAFPLKKIKKEKNLSLLFSEVKKLKNLGSYDYIIDMQGLIKSAVIARMVGKNIYGFDKNSTREGLGAFLYHKSFEIDYAKNVILRGVELVNKTLNLHITKSDIEQKEPVFRFEKNSFNNNIVIIVGSSWQSKIYPPQNYIKILNELKINASIVYGNDNEKKMAQMIVDGCKYATLAPKLTLSQLIDFISNSKLVIGPDSGPTHIAWAQNIPSITIFGPTPYFRNTLTSNINKVVFAKDVDPLNLNKNDFCIKNINPKKIINLAKQLFLYSPRA